MLPSAPSLRRRGTYKLSPADCVSILNLDRMHADAEYFHSRISKLDGTGDLGEHVVNVVRAKDITSDAKRSSIEKPQEGKVSPATTAGSTETT